MFGVAMGKTKRRNTCHSMQSKHRGGIATALAGSCFHQPRFVRHRPCIEGFPKVSNDGFVDVPPVRVNLVLLSVGHLRGMK